MTFHDAMSATASGFELVGAVVLIVGFGFGFARGGLSIAQGMPASQAYRTLRSFVGRTILLGLEVLVAADLIRTVAVEPSWESVGVLAVIVLIRTFLSFTIELEIDGRVARRREDPSTLGQGTVGSGDGRPVKRPA
jgi:uncharacterized membrane protein